ncbi:MAG TPA: phosphate ABC transporter substrate-binding protein PstS [Ilumatobacteraceae bacterium]|nr:phosphate ABC transporter substrate-binding protein PstS [Ilumatobacteraceae bacterium]
MSISPTPVHSHRSAGRRRLYDARRIGAIVFASTVALVACGDDDASSPRSTPEPPTLAGSGSSAMGTAMTAWSSEFERQSGIGVEYDAIGSGAGRDQFLDGTVPFAGSDVPLDDEEYAQSVERCSGERGAVNLPHFVSPIAVAYNLPEIEGEQLNLTNDALALIFLGEIDNWSDPALAEANPDLTLPDRPIEVIVRNDNSGTTNNFTQYLAANAPDVWTPGVFSDWFDEGPSGVGSAQFTEGVVAAVAAGEGTIGYADLGQIGSLSAAAIEVAGGFEMPTPEGAAALFESSERLTGNNDADFAFELNRTPDTPGVYPLSLVAYHIVCLDYEDADTAERIREFMTFAGSETGQAIARDLAGSSPISDSLREQLASTINEIGPTS